MEWILLASILCVAASVGFGVWRTDRLERERRLEREAATAERGEYIRALTTSLQSMTEQLVKATTKPTAPSQRFIPIHQARPGDPETLAALEKQLKAGQEAPEPM